MNQKRITIGGHLAVIALTLILIAMHEGYRLGSPQFVVWGGSYYDGYEYFLILIFLLLALALTLYSSLISSISKLVCFGIVLNLYLGIFRFTFALYGEGEKISLLLQKTIYLDSASLLLVGFLAVAELFGIRRLLKKT